MEEVILDQCSTCPGHCCILLSLPFNKDELLKRAQDTTLPLMYRKDALKAHRWMAEPCQSIKLDYIKSTFRGNFYSCSKLIDGKCSVYNIRPSFCKWYGKGCNPSTTFNAISEEECSQYLQTQTDQ